MYLYFLDRSAGIVAGDLYCDGLFIEEFAKWLKIEALILRCNGEGRVDVVGSRYDNAGDAVVLEVAHYSDQPVHSNAIKSSGSNELIHARDDLKEKIHQ